MPPPQQVQPNEQVLRAVDAFRTALVKTLGAKSNNAEAIVASAINRVLRFSTQSSVPGDPHEEKIMTALQGMLINIPGSNLLAVQQATPSQPPQQMQQPAPRPPQPAQPQSQPTAPVTQTSANPDVATKAPAAAPFVQRPSFGGPVQRPSINPVSVPRPPMMTPGMARTSSGSAAVAPVRTGPTTPASASPAPVASVGQENGSNPAAQKPAVNESFRRPLEDSPNQSTPASASPAPTASVGQVNGATVPAQKPAMNDNGKRPLEDTEDMGDRDFKRLSTTGPPPLKA